MMKVQNGAMKLRIGKLGSEEINKVQNMLTKF